MLLHFEEVAGKAENWPLKEMHTKEKCQLKDISSENADLVALWHAATDHRLIKKHGIINLSISQDFVSCSLLHYCK